MQFYESINLYVKFISQLQLPSLKCRIQDIQLICTGYETYLGLGVAYPGVDNSPSLALVPSSPAMAPPIGTVPPVMSGFSRRRVSISLLASDSVFAPGLGSPPKKIAADLLILV